EGLVWILPDETFSHLATGRWYRKHLKNVTSFIRCNSLQSMHALARAGAGLAVLPCYLGEGTRELRRLSDPLDGESVDLWLHVNQDTQQMARVRIVMEFLVERLQGLEAQLELSSGF
ncbi:MAG: LysR substrate-binding domain-containing protein, partial [Pseudomonadota bacterium]|nr:LysR substrate-binding domain-containing protein [Pseudomonadota bacterium]